MGELLAISTPVKSVWAIPSEVELDKDKAGKLASLLEMPLAELQKRFADTSRDFVYVKDIVRIMLHFWKNSKHAPSGIYNLGTGRARSFKDLGLAVFDAVGAKPRFEWIEMPDSLKNQYQYFTEADLDKLRNEGGFTADLHSLEDGVIDYVRNYLMTSQPYLG